MTVTPHTENPSENIGNRADAAMILALAREAVAHSGGSEMALDALSQITQAVNSGKLNSSNLSSLASTVGAIADANPSKSDDDLDALYRIRLASIMAGQEAQEKAASIAAREEMQSVESKIFGRDNIYKDQLNFHGDKQKEDAYYADAEKRKQQIDHELARHTLDGDVNANVLEHQQLIEAQKNGADVRQEWNQLSKTTENLFQAKMAKGESTQELKDKLRPLITQFAEDKHLTQDQIDKLMADPKHIFANMEPYLGDDKASKHLEHEIKAVDRRESQPIADAAVTASAAPAKDAPVKDAPKAISDSGSGIDDIQARMASMGVQADASATEGHGLGTLGIQKSSANTPAMSS